MDRPVTSPPITSIILVPWNRNRWPKSWVPVKISNVGVRARSPSKRVSLQDKTGATQPAFHTGDDLAIIIRYHAAEPVKAPKFGLSIFRKDGLQLSSPNQASSGIPIDEVHGHGTIGYHIHQLPLLPAEYFLTVSVHDELGLQVYDYHDRAYPFRVLPRGSEKNDGLIELPASWEWRPG